MQRTIPIDLATAAHIREQRQRARLTQNDIALAVHVSESTINKIETGRTPVAPSLLAAINQAIAQQATIGLERAVLAQ